MEKFGKECKRLMVVQINEKLKNSSALFVTSFSAIGVAEQDELRSKLHEVEAKFFMVKNRIAVQAFKQAERERLSAFITGPTAIAFGGRDSVSLSKVLVDFAGKHEKFKILGAYVDKQLLDLNLVKILASIPSRETLLAQIVAGINSPIQGLVNTLSATIRNLVVVLHKISEKEKEK